MDYIAEIQAPIAEELATYESLFQQSLQHDNPLLQKVLTHLSQHSGKRMRPMLVLLSAKYVGNVNPSVYQVALALEFLHTASLVHDDVVDESDRRRNQPSVNASFGNKVAVLSGDFLLSKALQYAAATQSTQFFSLVSQLGQSLADGELLQLSNTFTDKYDESAYFDVIRHKTASLFSLAAQGGALMADATPEDVERMRRFGQLLGMSFQVRDDIFDYDNSHDVGKPTGNDMKEGKLTLPVLYALRKHPDEDMMLKASHVRAMTATQEEIDDLVRFTIEQGGIEYASWQMSEFRMMANGLIEEKKDSAVAESLRLYVDYVSNRPY